MLNNAAIAALLRMQVTYTAKELGWRPVKRAPLRGRFPFVNHLN
jgi:hypothetical protein